MTSTGAPCVWLTGRRGAGKRTVATRAAAALRAEGRPCAVLLPEDLDAHLRGGPTEGGLDAVAWLANLLTGSGVPVIVAADVPHRSARAALADAIHRFVEIHVDAPAAVCAQRAGRDDPTYEAPIAPTHRIPTDDRDVAAAAALLVAYVEGLATGE